MALSPDYCVGPVGPGWGWSKCRADAQAVASLTRVFRSSRPGSTGVPRVKTPSDTAAPPWDRPLVRRRTF